MHSVATASDPLGHLPSAVDSPVVRPRRYGERCRRSGQGGPGVGQHAAVQHVDQCAGALAAGRDGQYRVEQAEQVGLVGVRCRWKWDPVTHRPGDEIGEPVVGGRDDDVLVAGAGDDFVSGDRGSDTVTGGTGADIFHTFAGAGTDRVTDFNRAEGDRVAVLSGQTYTVSQEGAYVVIDLSGGDRMTLVGVQQSSLTGDWIFSFG